MATLICAAAINYEIRPVPDFNGFIAHMDELIEAAAAQGAQLIVFPESIDLERLAYAPEVSDAQVKDFLARDTQRTFDYLQKISAEKDITIIGGSHMFDTGAGVVNRALIVQRGRMTFQDKLILTQYEIAPWGLMPGAGLYPVGDIGVTVCYDSEFPSSGRALADAGVLVQCVPAYTETRYGFQRVRWSCQARAIEHQNYVIHTSLVGNLGREPIVSTFGNSAILCPSFEPFPISGALAQTADNVEAIAIADLDLDLLYAVRNSGDVRNFNDRDKGDFTIHR